MATSCGSSASSESPSSPSTSQPFQIMDKPGGKSVLWEYFGLEKGRNGRPVEVNVAICRSCFQRVAAKNGNTSNLLTHLRTHHPSLHVQVKQAMNAKVHQRPPKSRTPQSLQVGQSTIQETLKYDRSSSFLDPRFKVKYLDEDEVEHVKLKLQSLLMAAPSESIASSNSECSVLNCNDSESPAPPPAKKRNLGTLFKDNEEKSDRNLETACSSISKEEELLMQLQAYISIPRLDFEENPLEWWKIHSSNYPLLAAFAKRFLSVCATSSPSERLFSSSGNIVSPTRMKLSPTK